MSIEKQVEVEELFSKTNLDRVVLNEVGHTDPRFLKSIFKIGTESDLDPMKAGQALWIEILRDPKDHHIQSIASRLGMRLGFVGLEAAERGSQLLELCADQDIYDIHLYPNRVIVKPRIKLSDDILDGINQFQYMPPMLSEPQNWISNSKGGWLTFDKHVVLGKGNHHQEQQDLETLNKLQQIPWKMDVGVITQFVSKERYKNDREVFARYFGEEFYFVWRFDKRGRMYSSGYNINLQSEQFRRAALSFAQAEPVTKEGIKWLKIAVANAFGHDKLTFDERVEWVDDQKEFDIADAKEEIFAWKYLNALQTALDGESVNANMFLDATASGIQIMAALSNCSQTAEFVNMNTYLRNDIYDAVTREMNGMLKKEDSVERSDVKKPVMTHYYNSIANPREHFNRAQLEAFYTVVRNAFPGAEDVMDSINSCWSDKSLFRWEMPDGHVVRIRAKQTQMAQINYLGQTFQYAYTDYSSSGNGRHLAPNIIHSVDGWIAREMVKRASFPLAHIHDAFTAHPNNMGAVCDLYRSILAEIAESDVLQDILRQVTGNQRLVYRKLGKSLASDIRKSVHMLS